MNLLIRISTNVFGLIFLCSCATQGNRQSEITWKKNQQLILVLSDGWNVNHGMLFRFQYQHHHWISVGNPFTVSLGKNGVAWGAGMPKLHNKKTIKTEGDMRSPAGIYQIGQSFGYAPKSNSSYPYQTLTKDDYCIDNSQSAYYNRIINQQQITFDPVKDSTEPMRRDIHLNGDQLYKLGFVLKYNPQNIPKAGSCIFVHLRQAATATTAGCTAMDEQNMEELLSWLDKHNDPVFILLPNDIYKQNIYKWDLPKIAKYE
ncbi:D-peptidoglycan transpeptidase YkuD [Commensalibacter communis]|uniref:ErfK/YbiS/YcfS/YnhG family (PUBMED:16647082) n=1 Tax=Commensalibacter communis TaxID=2972786 RepID=A0A9W4XCW0_9PROT|nr:L,D-transpeptidase family protein [Commensalibacter communis]CAI3925412.1 D-peptidoglycan transpeptidase YkuD [Commensalibacter communis]CAI3925947.1 D-peptidoglycan transpeptidase YkuD [Commensalibacter communis]CAI3935397.1 D-peptidoglycan transpeptidase YkuD [Commensalibacter communis]CAI3937065.1 D-peptidoglycan transpeptidase YkuD [Commensalibacter communis]